MIEYDKTETNLILEVVEEIEDLKIRHSYSGRAMYGESCFGLVGDDSDFFLFFALLGAKDEGLSRDLAMKARTDSMGLSSIMYFPGRKLPEGSVSENDDDDDDDDDDE